MCLGKQESLSHFVFEAIDRLHFKRGSAPLVAKYECKFNQITLHLGFIRVINYKGT